MDQSFEKRARMAQDALESMIPSTMSPLARLAALAHDQEPDFTVVIEQFRKVCGSNVRDLAIALRFKPRQLAAIAAGEREPT